MPQIEKGWGGEEEMAELWTPAIPCRENWMDWNGLQHYSQGFFPKWDPGYSDVLCKFGNFTHKSILG